MQCFHPRTIRVPYTRYNYPEGPDAFSRDAQRGIQHLHSIQVPCGKCPACLRNRQMSWSFRIEEEERSHKFCGLFITLTYSNEFLPRGGSLKKVHLQKFFKRLKRLAGFPIVYYACGEYGSRYGRPHYHACLFFDEYLDWNLIVKAWKYGRRDIKPFLPSRGAYVAKYTMKQIGFDYGEKVAPFALMSKGIGKSFISGTGALLGRLNLFTVANQSGRIIPLPRYYKDRIYSPYQLAEHSKEVASQAFERALRYPDELACLARREFHYINVAVSRLKYRTLTDVL